MDSPGQQTPTQPPPRALQEDAATPAVNHAGGIARLMGDGVLFARVLARFRNEYCQAASGIRGALERGDTALALRLVHTLKGAAGMIEAVPLRREAHRLEQMLRSGSHGNDNDPEPALVRLQDELERVLRELDMLASQLPEPPATVAPPVSTAAPVPRYAAGHEDVLARLTFLLDEGNGDAVDLVRDGAPVLATQLGDAVYRALADAIEAFDFDAALALLQAHGSGD